MMVRKKLELVVGGIIFVVVTVLLVTFKISLLRDAPETPSRVPGARSGVSSSSIAGLTEATFSVLHIVDGDTIDVRDGAGKTERVRFVGIDTPESVDPRREVQCFGKEASAHVKKILSGKIVTMEAKPDEDRDSYGRLLRYVYLDGKDIGLTLLSEGYAFSVCKKFPHEKCETYEAEAKKAEFEKLGLWSACRK